jgi:hypothetical protein
LVERSQMAQVLGEQELALAGVSAGRAAQVGAMLGADGVILGTVSEYGQSAQKGNTIPVVGLACRLIDSKSGKIVWSADLAQRASSASMTVPSRAGGRPRIDRRGVPEMERTP